MNNLNIEDWDAHGDSGKHVNRRLNNNANRQRRKRKNKGYTFWSAFLCLIALASLTCCLLLLIENHNLKNEAVETAAHIEELNVTPSFSEEEVGNMIKEASGKVSEESKNEILETMKAMLENGEGTAAMLRSLYADELVVAADGRYYFFPILDSLKHHSYNIEQFKMNEKNHLEYFENENVVSRKGIDVSKYQSKIDWKKVASDGVEYAFIRLGIRGATEGKLMLDETYEDNIEGASENNIDVGVYFFTQALNKKEAVEEAEFVLENIDAYDVSYPIVLDVEEITTKNRRTMEMTKQDWTDVCIAFCETIKAAGYTPMIYGNLKTFLLMVDLAQLEEYEKWFAYYQTPLYFPYEFSVWQYTDSGNVKGIKGGVDLNISMKDWKNE